MGGLSCTVTSMWALPAGLGGWGPLEPPQEWLHLSGSQEAGTGSSPLSTPTSSPPGEGRCLLGPALRGPATLGTKDPETGHQLGPVLSLPLLLRGHGSREQRSDILPQASHAPGLCHLTRNMSCGLFPYLLVRFWVGGPPGSPGAGRTLQLGRAQASLSSLPRQAAGEGQAGRWR